MKAKREGDIVVLPVDKNVVDVFTGDGWDNWSRFEVTGKFPKLVKGKGVLENEYARLMRML